MRGNDGVMNDILADLTSNPNPSSDELQLLRVCPYRRVRVSVCRCLCVGVSVCVSVCLSPCLFVCPCVCVHFCLCVRVAVAYCRKESKVLTDQTIF